MADRQTAGALAWVIALVLTLQGLVGQIGQSRMAAEALDPLHALCLTVGLDLAAPQPAAEPELAKGPGLATGQADRQGAPHGKAPDCPCATLCRLAATTLALISLPPQLAAPRAPASLSASRPFIPLFLRIERGLTGQPRAPPLSS
ncbi:hypothetical protein [Rhizobium rhizosphaerae]|uniref:hypothetical protein n=1 Tax=Xaviernesmea rhizosphaerae TaxID=1672749 RepID=UPI001119C7A0|nr:hypothetical protein [Xaviernesmea rhizosphaerae]